MGRTFPFLLLVCVLACHRPESAATLLHRLPTRDATVLSVDVNALRRAGLLKLLAGRQSAEDPEYRTFTQNSGFDYQRDLDSAMAAFAPSGSFFLLRGRFDWKKLENYAKSNGGSCYDNLCRMQGSTPDRRISFLPLQEGLMALAVSTDDLAASRLTQLSPQRDIDVPVQPIWLSVPATALNRTASLPLPLQAIAGTMIGAERVTLTLGPRGEDFEARLEAVCKNANDAKALSVQLAKLTRLLQTAVKRKLSDDIPAVLASGSFLYKDSKVFGFWPIRKTLIQTLAGM